MAEHVCERLRAAGVKTESLRCADYAISPGVQADMGDGDEWPKIREKLLNADILVSPALLAGGAPSRRRSERRRRGARPRRVDHGRGGP